MIAPLRHRHRRMIVALAVALPIGWLAALAGRAPDAAMDALPETIAERDRRPDRSPDFESAELLARQPLTVRQWSESDGSIVSFEPHAPLTAPDLLLYLSAEQVEPGGPLPVDARLLGPIPARGERGFVLPPSHPGSQLVLYSLAWQEVVDHGELPSSPSRSEVPR